MSEQRPVVVLSAPEADVADGKVLLRRLVKAAADAGAGSAHRDEESAARTWFLVGGLALGDADEQRSVVDHDLLGRAAVRLAIDKVVCVGPTRAERAAWQGAVMEGSWGDEAMLVADVDELLARWNQPGAERPGAGDVVAIAGAIGPRRVLDALADWDLVVRQI